MKTYLKKRPFEIAFWGNNPKRAGFRYVRTHKTVEAAKKEIDRVETELLEAGENLARFQPAHIYGPGLGEGLGY